MKTYTRKLDRLRDNFFEKINLGIEDMSSVYIPLIDVPENYPDETHNGGVSYSVLMQTWEQHPIRIRLNYGEYIE